MKRLRMRPWFASLCFCLATITAVIAATPSDIRAGVVPSRGSGPADTRDADLELIQRVLERDIVRQKLLDHGVSPGEAMAKIRGLDDRELHLLASKMEGIPEGGSMVGLDSGAALLIMLALVAVVVVIVILLLGVKAVVSDVIHRPSPPERAPDPGGSPAPARQENSSK